MIYIGIGTYERAVAAIHVALKAGRKKHRIEINHDNTTNT